MAQNKTDHDADDTPHTAADGERDAEILIVEDERRLADVFESWLEQTHTTRTAYTGQDALDALDGSVDLVLLERHLPDVSGRAVLQELEERGLQPQVAMVSAVEPGEKILHLDIDEYVRKPVTCAEMKGVVQRLLDRRSLDTELQSYFRKLSKKQTLEAEQPVSWLASNKEYQSLVETLTEQREQLPELPAGEEGLLAERESHERVGSPVC
jgi:DNA-binding response OmpR family regulator